MSDQKYVKSYFKTARPKYDQQRLIQRPQATEQQKAVAKELQNCLWNSVFRLGCLPGKIPICYLIGPMAVVIKSEWDKAWRAYGEIARNEVLQNNEINAPYTWGFNPINPNVLVNVESDAFVAFVLNWITANILPYELACTMFCNELKNFKDEDLQSLKTTLERYMRDNKNGPCSPAEITYEQGQKLALFISQASESCLPLSPAQVQALITVPKNHVGLKNLLLYQVKKDQLSSQFAKNSQVAKTCQLDLSDSKEQSPKQTNFLSSTDEE